MNVLCKASSEGKFTWTMPSAAENVKKTSVENERLSELQSRFRTLEWKNYR